MILLIMVDCQLWGGTEGNAPSNSNCHLFIKRSTGQIGIGTTTPETLLTIGNHPFTDGTRDLLRFPSKRHNESFTIRNNDDVSTGRLEFFGVIVEMVVEATIIQ